MLVYGILKPYTNISCFSTTRHGGCGEGAYATFNCTHYCGDCPENVKANLEILAASLPKRPRVFVIPRQTHTTNVRVIADVPTEAELHEVDAVVTPLRDFCLCVSTADCVPVLLYDKVCRSSHPCRLARNGRAHCGKDARNDGVALWHGRQGCDSLHRSKHLVGIVRGRR